MGWVTMEEKKKKKKNFLQIQIINKIIFFFKLDKKKVLEKKIKELLKFL